MSRFLILPLPALLLSGAALAQQAIPAPVATVPPAASAVPPPIVYSLPVPTPSASATQIIPLATPGPRPVGTPTSRPRTSATPTPRPTPVATATPSPTPLVTASPAPQVAPSPAPPAATPTPAALPAATPAAPEDAQGGGWLLPFLGAVVIAALLGVILYRRRRPGPAQFAEEAIVPAIAAEPLAKPRAAPAPRQTSPSPPQPLVPRAWLVFDLVPRRSGVNLLTATLDAEIVVRNEGDAPADDIRVDVRLLSARAGQEAELAAIFAESGARPAVAPFALAPGETRRFTTLVTLPRGAINVLTAADRPMFVPVAAVNVRYATAGVTGQTAGAFAVGAERAGAAKLAPFWLDVPARMHEAIAARPHALALRS